MREDPSTASPSGIPSLETVLRAVPLPGVLLDNDGRILAANAEAEEVMGPLVGQRLAERAVSPEAAGTLCERFRQTGYLQRASLDARRQDGAVRQLMLSARRLDQHFLVVFEDVTEMREREADLARARDLAERAVRNKMRFFAAASHDLRQPMQAIALFASALEAHASGPQARQILGSLRISLRVMEEMFDQLLNMSRLDAGVLKAQPVDFLVSDLFEQLEAEFSPQVEGKGLRLTVVPSSLAIRSDPALLGRILRNLLSNAVRYTDSGRILLGARRHRGKVRLVVSDTGVGIPDDRRLEIFQEFRQGERRPDGGGLGLGLAIVQRLVLLLGHRLDLFSVPGRGTSFCVEVPLVETIELEDEDDEGLDLVMDLGGLTVAVVDDDPVICAGLLALLEGWGSRGVAAATGQQAADRLQAAGLVPDVVLADLRLRGGGSGVEAIHEIERRLSCHPPAFLLTGVSEATEAVQGYPILLKPVDPARLRRVVAGAAGRLAPPGKAAG